MSFGELMKSKREELGITRAELAKDLAIYRQGVAHYENDRQLPNLRTATAIADALGIPYLEMCRAVGGDR